MLADLSGTGYNGLAGPFTPDGRKLVVGSFEGLMYVLDLEILLSGGPIEEVVVWETEAHNNLILRVMVSPDGTMAATSA